MNLSWTDVIYIFKYLINDHINITYCSIQPFNSSSRIKGKFCILNYELGQRSHPSHRLGTLPP